MEGSHSEPDVFRKAAAQSAVAAGEHEKALEIASEALDRDPRNIEALQYRAASEFALDREIEFLTTIDLMIKASSHPYLPLTIKAIGLAGFRQYEEAKQAAEEALRLKPDHAAAWDALADANLPGDPAAAQAAAEKAVELEPESESHIRTLTRAALARKDFETALKYSEKVLENNEDDARFLALKATALSQLGRTGDALGVAERAYELAPKEGWALRPLGALLALNGDLARAQQVFLDWVADDPDDPDSWAGLGLAYVWQDQLEQALSALRKAVELDADDLRYRVWLGNALLKLGEDAEALLTFSEVCEVDSSRKEAWLGKCTAERALGFSEQSVESARQALAIDSYKEASIWLELARSYSAADRHTNAWRAFAEAAKRDTSSFDAALGMAIESITCHNETRALDELKAAEERVGEQALIEFNRGVAYYKLGREASARDAWKRAHHLDPELGAANVLVARLSREPEAGGWTDYWFGSVQVWRKLAGATLFICLIFFLAIPVLESHLIRGLETGQLSIEAFIPALLIALLILLPTIRSLAFGSVALDVAPLTAPASGSAIDPTRILPIFAREDLDVAELLHD